MRIVFVSSAFTRVTLIPLSINARRNVRNTSGRTEGLSTRQIDFCPALCQLLFWAVPAQPESAKAAEESARIRQDFKRMFLKVNLFNGVDCIPRLTKYNSSTWVFARYKPKLISCEYNFKIQFGKSFSLCRKKITRLPHPRFGIRCGRSF